MSYRFSKKNKDKDILEIQREIEDNLATNEDVSEKQDVVKSIKKAEPKLTDMSNGQKIIYDDGTNQWKYERYGSRLFKTQLTEVT